MENELNNQILYEIENLNISDELKTNLLFFNDKIQNISKIEDNIHFDIIIENWNKKEIDILLEYTTNIIEQYNLYTEFIKYQNNTKIETIENSVLIIDDFDIFYNKIIDNYQKDKHIINFFKNIKMNNNILILASSSLMDSNLKSINNTIFDPNLCIHLTKQLNTKELYNQLIQKYKNKNISYKLSYKTFENIIDTLKSNNYIKNFDIVEYIYDYSIKKMILNNKTIINKKTFENFIQDDYTEIKQPIKKQNLDNLIGLDNIKNQLDSLYNYLEFSKKNNLNDSLYLNLFFLGKPGTGKTTVARMYADKLYELGFIKENKLIEILPNDLLGEYVGQTKNTTRKILEKASHGVLFIDEAYLLYTNTYKNGKNPYMEEAVVELIKYLEDKEHVVIFAGYPNEMRQIYKANPGIKSRIYGEILFEDYKIDELYQILIQNLKEKGLNIDKKSKEKIINYIHDLKNDKDFGNARTIIQLAQKMIINHANRKFAKEDIILDYKDLPRIEVKNNIRMGFELYDK